MQLINNGRSFVRRLNTAKLIKIGNPEVFAIACDIDRVEDAIREIVLFTSGMNSLIILDDCATSESTKKEQANS